MKNETIWIDGKAMWKPDTYTFRNGMVTYHIDNYKLFAQVWLIKTIYDSEIKREFSALCLHKTAEIKEKEDKSMAELIHD